MAAKRESNDRITLATVFALASLPLFLLRSFPFNDDWAFIFPVEHWLRTGTIQLSQGGSPTLLFQIVWGRLFCLPFGFSFDALRLSTLVLALAGLLAFRETLRLLGASRPASFAGALLLMFNPLFFVLGESFMTDVPALSLMLIAGWAFVEGSGQSSRRKGDSWFLLGGIFSALAYLVRQTGIAPAGAICLWLFAQRQKNWRRLAAAALPPLAAALADAAWLRAAGSPYAVRSYLFAATLNHLSHPGLFLAHALSRLGGATLYLGMFLSPLALARVIRRRGAWAPAAALGAFWLVLIVGRILPQTGNTVGRFGLGTCSMGADCAFKAAGIFGASWFWISATFAAPFLLALILWDLDRPKGLPAAYAGGLFLAFALALLGRDFFDRYYLPIFPAAIALVLPNFDFRWRGFALPFVLLAAWSLSGTWDCLAWNQARWQAGRRLETAGYDPKQIEAGIDWDSYYNFEDRMNDLLSSKKAESLNWDSWYQGLDFRAFVTFSPRPRAGDWTALGQVEYWSPLSLQTERLYLWGSAKRDGA